MRARRVGGAVLGLAGVLALPACTNADEPDVRAAAASFAGGDDQARCGLLAPATLSSLEAEEGAACAEAIGQLPLGSGDVVSVEVWGSDALVRLTDDTLFLTRTTRGGRSAPRPAHRGGTGPTCVSWRRREGRAGVFVAYLVLIVAGLGYFTSLGLLGR